MSARPHLPRPRAGFTLIEMMIALTVVTIILLATTAALQKEAENVSEMQTLSLSERMVQDLFTKIEDRLEFAQGIDARTTLAAALGSGTTASMTLDDSFGFPHFGNVLLSPGTASEERVRYDVHDAPNDALDTLTRGERGTSGSSHSAGALALWEGIAVPIEQQVGPPANAFDGQTNDIRGPVFYRGDGVGFAYRRPVAPAGDGNFIGPAGIMWGSTVGGVDTEDGCAAIVFQPVAEVREADRGFDINRDGDLTDVFDLGRIVDLSWNALNPAFGSSELNLVSPILLQEQEDYGSDLDGDGLQDPMFLWTPDSGRLRIRVFALLGDVNGRQVVRRFETVLYLRNGTAD